MRADFLSKALAYRPFADALQGRNLITVGPMQREELRQAIEQPAALRNVRPEEGLTERILDAVGEEAGELPLVQFTLTELWERQIPPAFGKPGRLTHAAYEAIGGVEQALAEYAERVYNKLSADNRQRARHIFTQLVQPGAGTEDTKRVATRRDIDEDDWPLVTKLATARLVVTGNTMGTTFRSGVHLNPEDTVDVAHEALIRGWQRLREWIDEVREFRMWQERLRSAMRQWQASNRDEGALLRGAPLAEAEQWQQERTLAQEEQHFIQISLDLRDQEQQEREARQQRELELAQHNAELQRRAGKRLRAWLMIATLLTIVAIGAAFMAYRQRTETERQGQVSFVHLVTTLANEHVATGKREKAALLARQAYLLNLDCRAGAGDQIAKALGMALALPDEDVATLVDLVCRQARRDLTTEEWQQLVKRDDVSYTPCDNLIGSEKMLRLRSEPLVTEERQHLSLNVRADGYVATDIANDFQDLGTVNTSVGLGEVIIDRATGLMWEQSGSKEGLTYEAAKEYIDLLNEEELGGYRGWRLPTVEELLSVVEEERGENDLRINPVFDMQPWCWSADIGRIKDESSPGSAWLVYFYHGNVYWSHLLLNFYYVRAVRSSQ